MTHPHPKFRDDLVVSEQTTSAGPVYVVKDPRDGRFFRFGPKERFITRRLDGETSLETIAGLTQAEFGEAATADDVGAFVEGLSKLALLEPRESARSGMEPRGLPRRPGRLRGDLLYLRFKAFDPDRFLEKLARRLGFCFGPGFLVLSAALITMAASITAADWDEIWRDLPALVSVEAFIAAWVTLLFVTALHELAHGITCRRFGGEVHEMGFMLLYFQPAFYCNVSEAWLIPEKWKRLWVTFAGAWFELVLWSIATLVWRVTEPMTWPNFLALVVIATSGIKSLFNLNPLIKLDGYYLLSDWLEIPNLRAKAFGVFSRSPSCPTSSPREKKICLSYGLLAGSYSFMFLGLILMHFGGYLVERYQGYGFVAYSGFMMMAFRRPLKRSFASLARRFRPDPGPWQVRAMAGRAGAWLLLPAALAALSAGRMELKVSGDTTVLPARNAEVRALVEGLIEEVYCEEGTRVEAGAPIARLSDRDLRAELQKVQASLAEARAKLRLARSGPRPEEAALARTSVAKARERLAFSRKDLDRSERLFGESLLSREQLEKIEEATSVRARELEEARSSQKLLLAGRRPEEIDSAEAEVSALEAQSRHLSERMRQLVLASPIAGVVTTPKPKEKVGQYVKMGDLVVQVQDLSGVSAEIAVSEKEIGDVRVGQPVVLRTRAFPDKEFTGTVESIAMAAVEQTEGWRTRVFNVTTAIDNDGLLLRPEMTGSAKILCGKRSILNIATRRIARYIRVEFWSWW